MTIAKLEELKKAYEWEQARILAWIDDLNQHSFADNDNVPSPVVKKFYEIWIDYFKEIRASNQEVIVRCAAAIETRDEAEAAKVSEFINSHYHQIKILEEIQRSTGNSREKSRYFQAIDQGLLLEVTARNEIEKFLNTP
jgi:hypothetical protein